MTNGIGLSFVCHLSVKCLSNVCQMSIICLSFVWQMSDKCHLSVICRHLSAPHTAGLISSPVGPNLRHEKSRKSSKNGITESHACVFVVNHSFLGPVPRKSRKVTESHGESWRVTRGPLSEPFSHPATGQTNASQLCHWLGED